MARNKYKKEKYEGTFACGHEGVITIGGYSQEYRDKEAEKAFWGDCLDCEIRKTLAKAEVIEYNLGLPQLKGSEAQIEWARQIRYKEISKRQEYLEKYTKHKDLNPKELRLFEEVMDRIFRKVQSTYWIDNRRWGVYSDIVEDFKDALYEEEVKMANYSIIKKTAELEIDAYKGITLDIESKTEVVEIYGGKENPRRLLNNLSKEEAEEKFEIYNTVFDYKGRFYITEFYLINNETGEVVATSYPDEEEIIYHLTDLAIFKFDDFLENNANLKTDDTRRIVTDLVNTSNFTKDLDQDIKGYYIKEVVYEAFNKMRDLRYFGYNRKKDYFFRVPGTRLQKLMPLKYETEIYDYMTNVDHVENVNVGFLESNYYVKLVIDKDIEFEPGTYPLSNMIKSIDLSNGYKKFDGIEIEGKNYNYILKLDAVVGQGKQVAIVNFNLIAVFDKNGVRQSEPDRYWQRERDAKKERDQENLNIYLTDDYYNYITLGATISNLHYLGYKWIDYKDYDLDNNKIWIKRLDDDIEYKDDGFYAYFDVIKKADDLKDYELRLKEIESVDKK